MISYSENELLLKRINNTKLATNESRKKLKDLFSQMSKEEKLLLDDNEDKGRFSIVSKADEAFQVLSSGDFQAKVKMGLFIEIFYSAYDDEVLELFISPRDDLTAYDSYVSMPSSDSEGNYLDTDENRKKYEMNKYKSSKQIWVDLEPGHYTLQILSFKQVPVEVSKAYETVQFQLYINYDFVNVPREAFMPPTLNYYGLLGF